MPRSVKSEIRDRVSEPTTRAVSAAPESTNCDAVARAYTNPEQPAITSMAAPLLMPSSSWRMQAAEGRV